MRNVLVAGIAAWTLAGCAGFSQDGGFGTVEEAARQHLGRTVIRGNSEAARGRIAAEVDQLLKQPLGADEAVQLALLNNRGLQASFAELGISEADLVQAGRLPNPRLSLLRVRNNDDFKIEQKIGRAHV